MEYKNHVSNVYMWLHSALGVISISFFFALFSANNDYSMQLQIAISLFAFGLPLNVAFAYLYKGLDLDNKAIKKVEENFIIKSLVVISMLPVPLAISLLIYDFLPMASYVFGFSSFLGIVLMFLFVWSFPNSHSIKPTKTIPKRKL